MMFEELLCSDNDLGTMSYSRMSDFDRNGPRALVKKSEVDNQGLRHGSAVDILMIDILEGSDVFNSEFEVTDIEAPTATALKLAKIVLANYIVPLSKQELLKLAKKNKFWSRYSDEKIYEQFTDAFLEYITLKLKAREKTLISTLDYLTAKESCDNLLYHEFTHDLFYNEHQNLYQTYFEYNYRGFKFRGLIDKILINHQEKKVYFQDIKTGEGKGSKFMKSFLEWRYYLQEAVYIKAAEVIFKNLGLSKEYQLMPFEFIYLCKTESIPRVWRVSETWHNAALKGFTLSKSYVYRGFEELLDEIEYHIMTNQFELPKNVFENQGCLELDSNLIELND